MSEVNEASEERCVAIPTAHPRGIRETRDSPYAYTHTVAERFLRDQRCGVHHRPERLLVRHHRGPQLERYGREPGAVREYRQLAVVCQDGDCEWIASAPTTPILLLRLRADCR